MARDAATEGEQFVFPGCSQIAHRDELPAGGMMLRHTYRTVAADQKVDELLTHFLMGHAPEGVSRRYVARMILNAGSAMREAQRKISRRIVTLLTSTVRSPALAPDSPQNAEVALLPALA